MDDQMEFEAIEPTQRGFPPLGEILEDLMILNPAVMAHGNGSRINKGNPLVLSESGFEVGFPG